MFDLIPLLHAIKQQIIYSLWASSSLFAKWRQKNWLDNFHLPLQILSYPPCPCCVPKDVDIWGCVNWALLPYGFWLGQGEEVVGVSRLEREIKAFIPLFLFASLSGHWQAVAMFLYLCSPLSCSLPLPLLWLPLHPSDHILSFSL